MEIEVEKSNQIIEKILNSKNILIISHRSPDPDSIGSNLTLKEIFKSPKRKITSACIDDISSSYHFFNEVLNFTKKFDPQNHDLIISVDCASIQQVGFMEEYKKSQKLNIEWINIDHHQANNQFGTINLVKEKAPATVLIIKKLMEQWKVEITPYIASCLLFGLYYDTGSFMHSSTNEEVLEAGCELLKKGANHKLIIKNLYKTKKIEQLKIWGEALNNIKITEENIAVSVIPNEDFINLDTSDINISGVIDYISSIKNTSFATILTNSKSGQIKGSLRTRKNNIDLSKIANSLGGGGHKKASGFTINGNIKKETYLSIKKETKNQ